MACGEHAGRHRPRGAFSPSREGHLPVISLFSARKYLAVLLVIFLLPMVFAAGCMKPGSTGQPVKQNANPAAYRPGDYDFRTTHGGIEREYLMHVPPSYRGEPMQVVIYLHGGGGSMEDARNQGLYGYSDKYGFILLSPDGTNRWGTQGLRTWNAGRWDDSG
ncbi:MAG TPA: hypothetical protein VLU98_01005, partial [Methanomicrobiales archaeon]|nr:hypothetical protein [Methanomicrobiales archaeon]